MVLNQTERYEKFYSENWVEKYSFWHELMDDMISSQIGIIVRALKSIKKSKVEFLDVGCGIGDVTNKALEMLKEKKIELTANDTSDEALEKYKTINKRFNPKLISKEMKKLPEILGSKFDLILFSHSLYGVSLEGLFEKYTRMLNKEGSILIFLTSHDSDTIQISKKFWNKVYGCKYDETLAEDVINKINQLNLTYSVQEFRQEVDFNRLRLINKNGIKGLLVPFLFRSGEFNEKDEISDYIENLSKKKKIYNIIKAIIVEG